jgi:hypothetical protein
MSEKPDYGEMETKDLPWVIHMMVEPPFNCHTHGLKELGSPVEVSMDAHDTALVTAVGVMLNDVGRYVASTGAVLGDDQVLKLGSIPLHLHAGRCSAHPDDPTFIHLAGIAPQCEECAAEAPSISRRDKLVELLDKFGIDGTENYRGNRFVVLEHGIQENDYQTMDTLEEVATFIATAIRRPFGFLGWYDLDDDEPHSHSCCFRIDVTHVSDEATASGMV